MVDLLQYAWFAGVSTPNCSVVIKNVAPWLDGQWYLPLGAFPGSCVFALPFVTDFIEGHVGKDFSLANVQDDIRKHYDSILDCSHWKP